MSIQYKFHIFRNLSAEILNVGDSVNINRYTEIGDGSDNLQEAIFQANILAEMEENSILIIDCFNWLVAEIIK